MCVGHRSLLSQPQGSVSAFILDIIFNSDPPVPYCPVVYISVVCVVVINISGGSDECCTPKNIHVRLMKLCAWDTGRCCRNRRGLCPRSYLILSLILILLSPTAPLFI